MNLINESKIQEKWQPILEQKTGIKDKYKLNWMSKYAHYHSLNEGFTAPQASLFNTIGMGNVTPPSTVAGGAGNFYSSSAKGSGDKFPSLLPLSIQVAARTVGFDIVSVIPMPGPSGVLTYLDYVYMGGRDAFGPGLGNQNPAIGGTGQAGTSKFADKFIVFKLNTGMFIDKNAGATSEASLTAFKNAAVGTTWAVTKTLSASLSDTTIDKLVIIVQKVGRSRIDGFPIFRILGEYTGNSDLTSSVTCTNLTAGQTQTVTYFSIFDGQNPTYFYSATYNQSTGAAQITNTTADMTVNYPDGTLTNVRGYAELVKALEDHIHGFSGAGPNDTDNFQGNGMDGRTAYEPMRRGVGETTYHRTMGLQPFTKFIEAGTYQVAAQVTTEQIQDMNRQYGIDVVSLMEQALINDTTQSVNKHILSRAFALGWSNHVKAYNAEKVNLNLNMIVSPTTPVTTAELLGQEGTLISMPIDPFVSYGSPNAFENQGTLQRRIQSKILAAANVIAQRGRRGPGNFVVTNLQIGTALQDSAQFTMYPLANTINQSNGALYPLGTIAGLTVYVDPNMDYNDTRVLVGRKGSDEEPGLKFMPYLLAESIQTIAEGTMAPKIALKSRYALAEAGFHPETQYLTFVVNLRDGNAQWHLATAEITIA